MDMQEMVIKATEKFKTGEGRIVDVLYGTSNGALHYTIDDAQKIAGTLPDKTVTTFYRDPEVRDMAKQYNELNKMVLVTDYIKLEKLKKRMPKYNEFLAYAEAMGIVPVAEPVFNFVQSKVFRTQKPTTAGLRDQIYMYSKGVVDAIFLRRYAQGQIWQVGDTLVFTCPTNTELMSGTYQQIFQPLLGEVK
jgi:hypothetical protein